MVFLDIGVHKNKINRDKENNMFVYTKSTKVYVSKPIELQYIYISIFVSNDSYSDIYRDESGIALKMVANFDVMLLIFIFTSIHRLR